MAVTIAKDYKTVVQHKIITGAQRIGYDAIDVTLGTPSRVSQQVGRVKQSLSNQVQFLGTTIEAKELLRDHLYGQIWNKQTKETLTGAECDAYVAEQLLADETLRNRVEALTQNLLQPSPVSGAATDTSNGFVNIMSGVSTFWDEIHMPIPLKLEQAVKVENMLLAINAGLDKDLDPETRKSMLSTIGCNKERLNELVPLSDYVQYEDRVKEGVRNEIAGELDLQGRELTEHEQILIEDLAADRMATSKMHAELGESRELTYEDMYGFSAGDLYEMFDNVGAEGVGEPVMAEPEQTPAGVVSRLSFPVTDGDIELKRDMTQDVSAYLEKCGVTDAIQSVLWTQEAGVWSEDMNTWELQPGNASLTILSEKPLTEEALSHLDTWISSDRVKGEQVSIDDPLWEEKLAPAMVVYQDILSGTIEENDAYMYGLTVAAATYDEVTSQSFEDAVSALSDEDVPSFGITEEDLAFATSYQQEQEEPYM